MQFIKPRKRCETEIQAELYLALKQAGYETYLEYQTNHCRFDCVVVKDNQIMAIFEVKSKRNPVINYGKQYKKYNSFGLPLFYVINSIDGALEWLTRLDQTGKYKMIDGPSRAGNRQNSESDLLTTSLR